MNERLMNPTVSLTRKDFATDEDWQRAIREGGTFNLRHGTRVHLPLGEEVDLDDDWGPSLPLIAEASISGDQGVEVITYTDEVTFHSDGSYSQRLA